MQLAYTIAPGRGATNALLDDLANTLIEKGFMIHGTVQKPSASASGHPCDGDIFVLPDGPKLSIAQNLGHGSRGCRIDPDALEKAVALCEARVGGQTSLLLINKFGKQECEGRGFRNLIADALAQNVPVLVGVNKLSIEDFLTFSAGAAQQLPATEAALLEWFQSSLALS